MAGDTDDEAATACTVFAAKHAKTCSDRVADTLYSGCRGRALCQVVHSSRTYLSVGVVLTFREPAAWRASSAQTDLPHTFISLIVRVSGCLL